MWGQKIKNSEGFTIIEVTLFLALTSLLLLVAFLGTGSTLGQVRFGDSGRNFQSFIQKQYDEIFNGLNARSGQQACANSLVEDASGSGAQNAGASNCLLLGKLLAITEGSNTITSYYVVGSEPTNVSNDLSSYNPTLVLTSTVDSYNIPWEARISGTKRVNDNRGINSVLFIRSPKSGEIVTYTFYRDVGDATGALTPYITANNRQKATNFCFTSADLVGRTAHVAMTTGSGKDSVTLNYDTISTDCNGIDGVTI